VKDAALRLLEQDARFRAAVREGIAQADREEFIEEEEMDAHIERMPCCDRVLAPELRDYGFRLHTVPLRPVPPPVAVP